MLLRYCREPIGEAEKLLVLGFPQVSLVDEIWVRWAPGTPDQNPILRIWLIFRLLELDARKHADAIETEFGQRTYHMALNFEVRHRTQRERPIRDGGSCIWKRPEVEVAP